MNPGCLAIGCGRRDKGHALEHFSVKHERNGNHAVALDLSELLVWCYVCDDYVVGARETLKWLSTDADGDGDVEMTEKDNFDTTTSNMRTEVHGVGTPNIIIN
mgnify:CR=1 FL=1